jgi:hypothetical protein
MKIYNYLIGPLKIQIMTKGKFILWYWWKSGGDVDSGSKK